MIGTYHDIRSLQQFWRDVMYAPDGKRGYYCKSSQKKRRKHRRRVGRGR